MRKFNKRFHDWNPHAVKRTFIILLCLAAVAIAISMFSCNPARKIERKDQEAVSRVNAKAELQVPVVNEWFKRNKIDTARKVTYVPGPEIQVPYAVPVRDTSREKKIRDSLLAIGKECGQAAQNGYDLGYEAAVSYYKAHPVTVKCPQSRIETITDHSLSDRLNDSLRLKEVALAYLAGQSAQKDAQLKEQSGKASTNLLIIICLAAALAISIFFHVKGLPGKLLTSIKK